MNFLDIITQNAQVSSYARPTGQVFVIRCVPDIFTDERINIGVCAIDGMTGQRKAKVVTESGRLHCLYGEDASSVLALAGVALEAALNGFPPPSSQITFDTPSPYYNCGLDEILDRTFSEQVTVALPQRQTDTGHRLTDEMAMQQISNLIKQRQNLAADWLAGTPQVLLQTERGPRAMVVPLQPRNGVGTIRSAAYSAQTLRTHLMDSVLDLDCASRYRNKRSAGLFVLRPQRASAKQKAAIDNAIDAVAWRSPKHLHLEASENPDDLADLISEWAAEANQD